MADLRRRLADLEAAVSEPPDTPLWARVPDDPECQRLARVVADRYGPTPPAFPWWMFAECPELRAPALRASRLAAARRAAGQGPPVPEAPLEEAGPGDGDEG